MEPMTVTRKEWRARHTDGMIMGAVLGTMIATVVAIMIVMGSMSMNA